MVSYFIISTLLIILFFTFGSFRPAKTQEITKGLYVVLCGFVNFYILKTNAGVVLFDTGVNPYIAKRGLVKLGIEPNAVTHVFLTHTDYDHAGGIKAFPQAKRYISKLEEQMINGKTARRGFLHNKQISKCITLEDGEIIDIDSISIKAHVVPGHTTGSTAYLINKNVFVSGDLLRISIKGDYLPFLWIMNMKHSQNVESVKAMQSIINDSEYILTGHTGFKRTK